ncbi:TIGR04282 family arsenosugar biosynthesis glycosyltransferase [Fulvivirgaceae bacterium BMA10]|uniref:TIGR04282 family arsenosugar biosynthesis glycosyltransferase n=1 Tax=Splendidivirga corallicola TaxID=3051826 RepID=A0ABT8KS07_9BACT|nr:TIGR04282 family arsenosugar biosynthesis glycosyltransferase [Fulvivirgaceae bacterium BMA10]
MSKNALIIFVKNPELGKVKTRLAATIGKPKALEIYKLLLSRTKEITSSLDCDKIVFYTDFIDKDDLWDNHQYHKQLQNGHDLGDRMLNAFDHVFRAGYESACIIGSDCYELTSQTIQEAFDQLTQREVVVGPTMDGGYYLLGMNKLHRDFFVHKKWSTSTVYADTLTDIKTHKLMYSTLELLSDVDEEKDLQTIDQFKEILN